MQTNASVDTVAESDQQAADVVDATDVEEELTGPEHDSETLSVNRAPVRDLADADRAGADRARAKVNGADQGLPRTSLFDHLSEADRMVLEPLASTGLFTQLQTFDEDVTEVIEKKAVFTELVVGASTVGTTSLTVGIVLWMLRSGSLVMSMISSLPAWTMMDPLAVLSAGASGADDDNVDDSLQSLLSRASNSGA